MGRIYKFPRVGAFRPPTRYTFGMAQTNREEAAMLTQEKYADHLASATMLGGFKGLEDMVDAGSTIQFRRSESPLQIGRYSVTAYHVTGDRFLLNMTSYGNTMQDAWLRLLGMLAAGKTESTATNTYPEGD